MNKYDESYRILIIAITIANLVNTGMNKQYHSYIEVANVNWHGYDPQQLYISKLQNNILHQKF